MKMLCDGHGEEKAAAAAVAAQHYVTTRTVRRYKKSAATGTLLRKSGSGKAQQKDRTLVNSFMEEKAAAFRYRFSLEEMAAWVKEEFGFGSRTYVSNVMKEFNWRKVIIVCWACVLCVLLVFMN